MMSVVIILEQSYRVYRLGENNSIVADHETRITFLCIQVQKLKKDEIFPLSLSIFLSVFLMN